MRSLKKIYSLLLDILFPPLCLICDRYLEKDVDTGSVCRNCSGHIVVNRYPRKIDSLLIRAATDYRDKNIQTLIRSLKYKGVKNVSVTLGKLLAEHLENEHLESAIIVPIPLHPMKERRRGYNQSALIALEVGRALGIPVENKGLRRIKNNKSQAMTADREERALNMRNAFAPGRNNGTLTGKTVILMDDVFTSGATMREAVKEIRKMKPKKIIPSVVAIAE